MTSPTKENQGVPVRTARALRKAGAVPVKPLTDRQGEIHRYVMSHIVEKGYAPTKDEIGQRFDVGERAAYLLLRTLERNGYISLEPYTARGVKVLRCDKGRPVKYRFERVREALG